MRLLNSLSQSLRPHLTSPGPPGGAAVNLLRRDDHPPILHRDAAGTRITPRYKMSIVCRQSREPAGQMSLLFFVFPAFVLFPFCALLTCRQVASCRGVNEAQLCVTELIQSEGAFLFPSWTSSLRLPSPTPPPPPDGAV